MARDLTDQPSAAPTRKVAASGIGGAAVVLALAILHGIGVEVPVDVDTLPVTEALTALAGFVSAYAIRDRAPR